MYCGRAVKPVELIGIWKWSEWDEYAVLGSRRMDCIGRWESDRADREIASQRHGRWAGIATREECLAVERCGRGRDTNLKSYIRHPVQKQGRPVPNRRSGQAERLRNTRSDETLSQESARTAHFSVTLKLNYHFVFVVSRPWTAILRFAMGRQISISNTEMVSKILATRVTGKIALPAQSGKLKRFACANVTVVATSKDLLPHGPNEFGQPKWVQTGKATGRCTYSIIVPPNSLFYLTAGGHGPFACTSIDVYITPTGAALGPIHVGLGKTRTVNLSVKKVTCNTLG
jgi:hypothetical protein